MHSSRSKQKYEKSALRISITGSTIFVILEIVMAVITRSQAVLLDSVYDGVEILMVFVSLSLVPLMYKPSSESHPFGYQQIESLFVVVKGAIMIAVTVGLILNNIQIIFHGGQHVNFSMVAYFEMSATLVSIAVIFLLRRMNSKLTSPIVIMEIQEWQIDSVASFVHRILSAADHNRRMVPAFDSLSRPDTGDHPVPFYASGSDKNRDHGTSGPVLTPSGGRNGSGDQRYRISDSCHIRGHKIIL